MLNSTTIAKNQQEVLEKAINLLASIWKKLVICEDGQAMADIGQFLTLIDGLLVQLPQPLAQEIVVKLPSLLQAMEEKNGMLMADILQYEIKPVLLGIME